MKIQLDARARLLAGLPVSERRLQLAGVSTALLEGGDSPPVVLLHGPGGNASHWMQVIPSLVETHRVIAPDLPGQGESDPGGGRLTADRVLQWLGELITQTCPTPPVLVGQTLGAAIAARFAGTHSHQLDRLVLVDALGLRRFEPSPEFGSALNDFLAEPTELTHDSLWRYCAFDLEAVRRRMDARWSPFRAYNLDRAQAPGARAALGGLMEQFGLPAIPPEELARIAVPTVLIWGRHDLATPLAVARSASERYGWPLHVIEQAADDPPIEQPEMLLRVLREVLGTADGRRPD